ncbi:mediator of RNA polymerase II transcription subunit 13 isoform X3 [Bombyx mori]|uniref:Mediator of RNA polymerase II transcription subunit 13 n=1 Tax=Bombyx mori TaxID=7091 RepID=A0A8R2LYY3_BOMMO|nr:mediator of RNA polymerase II transcription subunit 13 isoform X3 [Bombyx mori]
MTHQNHQTNGASLEDCHTNFFALTELFGIKWRKLVWGETSGGGEGEEGAAPLADPVISSYARCLAGDILCVWRRVPAPQPPPDIYDMMPAPPPPPPPLSLRAAKELWIFWYGEEPDLNGLVAPELISSQSEHGSWESGLSYECRSLLFKALHNLIERCLLSRDFVRLGKWFVQPYDGDEEDVGKSPWHLSFSFAFFLHGESTVCASVDVRQHPPVRTLTPKRLAKLNSPDNQADAKVILAPFGLEGALTGRQWGDGDAATARLLDAWRQLYPLEQGCGAVEVVCGGARMRYPAPYALLTDVARPPADVPHPPPAARAALALTAPAPHQTLEACYADPAGDKNDDFVDPSRKAPCTCTKWRRRRPPRPPPFHRRTLLARAHTLAHPGVCGGSGSPGSCSGSPPAAPPSASPHPHHAALPAHQQCSPQTSGLASTTLHTPAPTPDPLAPPTPAPSCLPPSKHNQGESGACPELRRRPVLPRAERRPDPLEDEHSLHMLYDYTTVHAWLEHPVKRFKSEEGRFREELALGPAPAADLYAGHQHTTPDLLPDVKRERQQDDAKEYKNLFTSDGLCPTFKDLEQIFDNSDDAASGDETMSTALDKCEEESKRCVGRCVRAEELSKMFPTPPSMEAHAQPSPGFSLPDDAPPRDDPPPDTAIEDWSFVFKPPTVYKYVGSSKYAALSTLPSQLLPPVALPPHAVYRPRPRRDPEPAAAAAAAAAAADTGVKRSASPASESRPAVACGAGGAGRGAARSCRPAAPPALTALPALPASPALPACPLLVNVLLADTVLNVFRDHNFDSCTVCVCNEGTKVIGNIRGADAATYLSEGGEGSGEEPASCTCGFSAIVNRRLAHRSGLFYEDEMEITGCAETVSSAGGARLGDVTGAVLAQLGSVHAAPTALARAARSAAAAHHPHEHLRLNLLEYSDGGAAAAKALRAAGGAYAGAGPPCSNAPVGGSINESAPSAVHRWPFIGARAPRSSRDVVRLMRRLRPLLQDAIQKRCCGARMWDGVTGPLTWRQFHRLAGRRNEDLCEPQPVPSLLVGHDRDWISLSPYALRHWERLSLEPYAYSRDVAYVVVAADCDALADPLRAFFRELSTAYEACRLGRHRPVTRLARDGLVRTGAARSGETDEWAGPLPAGRLGRYLRAYSEALRTALVPQLAALNLDRTLLEGERSDSMRPPATPERPSSPTDHEAEPAPAPPPPAAPDDDEAGPPALVLYIVEPPAATAHRASALHALLRLAANTYNHLHHHNPLIKIISLESVSEQWSGAGVGAGARALAFTVYSGARRLLHHHANGKSLTGFGTAAAANLFLQAKDDKNRAPYRLYSPAWVLAAPRALREVAETWGQGGTADAVLFVSYCLSHDQRWLLAAATDSRGELLDTIAINIHVPHRSRRRRSGTARRLGLTKLMDFTLGVMSQAAQPWRLVIGRVGRIGHGELKGWSWLLSRKNLDQVSTTLKDLCGSCGSGAPCVLSACLVSTEPDSCLRLMADRFTPDERFSQASIQSHLHTPRDVSATHILVFPTSATTQSTPMTFEQPLANGEDGDMMLLDINDEDGEHIDELLNCDMFNNMWAPGSPRRADDDAASPTPHLAQQRLRDDGREERVGTVLQQPLALGYTVSTAPLAGMPAWWWASCAHLRDACPAFLKTALHLHSVHGADDYAAFTQRRDQPAHPLDSQTTTDVLRYVLEGYNALSWLALDTSTHDRLSCLPLHVQVLMQLYHAAAALG